MDAPLTPPPLLSPEERLAIRREKARIRAARARAAQREANPPPPKPAPYDPQKLYEIHHRYYLKNRERFCEYARQARLKAKQVPERAIEEPLAIESH